MSQENQDGSNADFDATFQRELRERVADFEDPKYDYAMTFNRKDAFAALAIIAVSFVGLVAVYVLWGI